VIPFSVEAWKDGDGSELNRTVNLAECSQDEAGASNNLVFHEIQNAIESSQAGSQTNVVHHGGMVARCGIRFRLCSRPVPAGS
jgi:hypothetical protein